MESTSAPQLARFVASVSSGAPPRFNEEEVAVLAHVNSKVAAGETLADILDFVFEETRSIMPCDRIGVAFIDDAHERIVAHWARATYDPLLLGVGYTGDLAGSTLERVLAENSVRIINDLEAYYSDHHESHSTSVLLQEGVRSSMTCPLSVDGRKVGLLFRSCRVPHSYSEHEAALHAAMAERIAQAVEKAWQIEQLTQAGNDYTEMLRFVSHELKSPIASVIMQTRALQDGMFGPVPESQNEILEAVMERGQHLLNLTRDYLDLARFEGGSVAARMERSPDFVSRVCQPTLASFKSQLEEAGIKLTTNLADELAMTEFDPGLMRVALTNLLSNAIKYGNTPGQIHVEASYRDGSLELTVRNAGPGFPLEMRGHLFRKFSRLSKSELVKRPGSGVGLYVVWQIIRLHRGTVSARSVENDWAEFGFRIPILPVDHESQ
jgi:signal transduction histidine kinase